LEGGGDASVQNQSNQPIFTVFLLELDDLTGFDWFRTKPAQTNLNHRFRLEILKAS